MNPSNAKHNETVTVDVSNSYDFDGTFTGYSVNWGDGRTSNSMKYSHKYSREGSFTITVTVTDNSGKKSKDSKKVEVVKEIIIPSNGKPRTVVTTDLRADPDDEQVTGSFPRACQ